MMIRGNLPLGMDCYRFPADTRNGDALVSICADDDVRSMVGRDGVDEDVHCIRNRQRFPFLTGDEE
jgi:hypothetical protein